MEDGDWATPLCDEIYTMDAAVDIKLTLLEISKEVNGDADTSTLLHEVKKGILAMPSYAGHLLTDTIPTPEDAQLIQKQVLRFIQSKDKYTALTSTLLKSQAFHRIYKGSFSIEGRYTVVELPRTAYKKPFIPAFEGTYVGEKEDVFPISVSHQYPFVGIAQLGVDDDGPQSKGHCVGMDLVVFDEYNKRMYSSEDEFLDVFQGSFTGREWALIQSQSDFRLREFYVRWGMKEAYTKALGLGMGIDFSSIDLIVSGDDEVSCHGLYSNLVDQGLYLNGTVIYLNNERPKERWDFFFMPLYEQLTRNMVKACVCISVGPIPERESLSARFFNVDIGWTRLQSLIEWHQPNDSVRNGK